MQRIIKLVTRGRMAQMRAIEQNLLDRTDLMPRRRFLSFAAFTSSSVVASMAVLRVPEVVSAEADAEPDIIGHEYGFPIFAGDSPPEGYVRSHLPCAPAEYVDVPIEEFRSPKEPPVEILDFVNDRHVPRRTP
jgi:hypothetical protein